MFSCEKCPTQTLSVIYKDGARLCHSCYDEAKGGSSKAPFVHGDECDVIIKHGVCNPDGTPKRYRSKSAIREAAYQAGYFQGDDTPRTNHRLQEQRAREAEAKR